VRCRADSQLLQGSSSSPSPSSSVCCACCLQSHQQQQKPAQVDSHRVRGRPTPTRLPLPAPHSRRCPLPIAMQLPTAASTQLAPGMVVGVRCPVSSPPPPLPRQAALSPLPCSLRETERHFASYVAHCANPPVTWNAMCHLLAAHLASGNQLLRLQFVAWIAQCKHDSGTAVKCGTSCWGVRFVQWNHLHQDRSSSTDSLLFNVAFRCEWAEATPLEVPHQFISSPPTPEPPRTWAGLFVRCPQ
jgi:hypothetical protein